MYGTGEFFFTSTYGNLNRNYFVVFDRYTFDRVFRRRTNVFLCENLSGITNCFDLFIVCVDDFAGVNATPIDWVLINRRLR